jgi:hypothetical protein
MLLRQFLGSLPGPNKRECSCRWNGAAHALWSLISPTQLIAPRLGTTDRLTASITDHFRPHALTDAANAIGVPSATRWRRNRQAGAGLALQRFEL